jgi:hypothetical protein
LPSGPILAAVPTSDETFIVRVRRSERDAIVEQPSASRRRRIPDVAGVGELIGVWLAQPPSSASGARRDNDKEEAS